MKDLADAFSIQRAKFEYEKATGLKKLYSTRSKEVTLGIMDGEYSNRLTLFHFQNIMEISDGQQSFKDQSVVIYKFDNL